MPKQTRQGTDKRARELRATADRLWAEVVEVIMESDAAGGDGMLDALETAPGDPLAWHGEYVVDQVIEAQRKIERTLTLIKRSLPQDSTLVARIKRDGRM